MDPVSFLVENPYRTIPDRVAAQDIFKSEITDPDACLLGLFDLVVVNEAAMHAAVILAPDGQTIGASLYLIAEDLDPDHVRVKIEAPVCIRLRAVPTVFTHVAVNTSIRAPVLKHDTPFSSANNSVIMDLELTPVVAERVLEMHAAAPAPGKRIVMDVNVLIPPHKDSDPCTFDLEISYFNVMPDLIVRVNSIPSIFNRVTVAVNKDVVGLELEHGLSARINVIS
jgi:hypothetical protein